MRTFEIYRHPAGDLKAVKKGFSWPGFLFTWIWALVKGLWKVALVILGLLIALTLVEVVMELRNADFSYLLILAVAAFAICIETGENGNKWQANRLRAYGWEKVGEVQSQNAGYAIRQMQSEPQQT